MEKPVLKHFASIEQYIMYLPDKTEVLVEVYMNKIMDIEFYEIKDRKTGKTIKEHTYKQYVENYFKK